MYTGIVTSGKLTVKNQVVSVIFLLDNNLVFLCLLLIWLVFHACDYAALIVPTGWGQISTPDFYRVEMAQWRLNSDDEFEL
jgi:hypothetical protein